jgi:hypothetical protein
MDDKQTYEAPTLVRRESLGNIVAVAGSTPPP